MNIEKNLIFCPECRKVTEYELRKVTIKKTIREKEYEFNITEAFCKKCGSEIGVHGLMDRNAQVIDEQYRALEEIITIPEIRKLIQLYTFRKEELSSALGFEDNILTQYLNGQIPSKKHSDIMRRVLSSTDKYF